MRIWLKPDKMASLGLSTSDILNAVREQNVRIDPSRPASSLSAREVRALHRAIVAILERAIKAEGTTFRDYRTGTGQPGSFQLRLNVYGRGGEPCRRCGHRLVTTHSIDARATTMCAWCQG